MPDGTTITNYCEGLNDNMVVEEVRELGRTFQTEILLTGYQLNFEKYVGLGVAALAPKKQSSSIPTRSFLPRLEFPRPHLIVLLKKLNNLLQGPK